MRLQLPLAWLLGLSLLICPRFAAADTPLLSFGQDPPVTGAGAIAGMDRRATLVVDAMACGDELKFLNGIDHGRLSGDWPAGHLIAKAAYLARTQVDCVDVEPISRHWGSQMGIIDSEEGKALWDRFLDAGGENAPPGARMMPAMLFADFIQKAYDARFGPACKGIVRVDRNQDVRIELTSACLMRQIAGVITDERLGRWKYHDGGRVQVPLNPGTDGLFCATELRGAGEGDWDMKVTDYTRLTYLLDDARGRHPDLEADAGAALLKLEDHLLTLRDGPATESYGALWSCGNPDNRSGSAEEHIGAADYDRDVARSVSDDGPSLLEKLLKWLAFLALVIVTIVTLGGAIGLLVGGAAAAGAGTTAFAAGAGVALILLLGGSETRIQETENHLFMQNSAKYLKNKRMLADLAGSGMPHDTSRLERDNRNVREWLLRRLSRVAREDFIEYNSKPYARLSHMAILNLADYACSSAGTRDLHDAGADAFLHCHEDDRSVQTAAAAVLDLSAAKAAVGSSQSRRIVPYRRLVDENMRYRDRWRQTASEAFNEPKRVMDLANGSDHLVAALQFWTGATEHGPNAMASNASLEQMLWHATSRYRPHALILDLAIDKSVPMEQTIRHAGAEHYSSGPRWLLTAGGDSTAKANGVEIFGDAFFIPAGSKKDRGVGVPTTLMAHTRGARRQDTYRDFLRFEGRKEDWGKDDETVLQSFSSNRCVSGRFACGLRLEIPTPIAQCLDRSMPIHAGAGTVRFLSSADCAPYRHDGGNGFMVAVYGASCRKNVSESCDWGFLEVAEANAYQGNLHFYRERFLTRNGANIAAWGASDGDDTLRIRPEGADNDIAFKPSGEDFGHDCRACGSALTHVADAHFRIGHPGWAGVFIDIDLSDPLKPRREAPDEVRP